MVRPSVLRGRIKRERIEREERVFIFNPSEMCALGIFSVLYRHNRRTYRVHIVAANKQTQPINRHIRHG